MSNYTSEEEMIEEQLKIIKQHISEYEAGLTTANECSNRIILELIGKKEEKKGETNV